MRRGCWWVGSDILCRVIRGVHWAKRGTKVGGHKGALPHCGHLGEGRSRQKEPPPGAPSTRKEAARPQLK